MKTHDELADAGVDIQHLVCCAKELIYAARRVRSKYGRGKNDEMLDWTEWTDVDDAANAVEEIIKENANGHAAAGEKPKNQEQASSPSHAPSCCVSSFFVDRSKIASSGGSGRKIGGWTAVEWIKNRCEALDRACESSQLGNAESLSSSKTLNHGEQFSLTCKCGEKHQLLYMEESPSLHVLKLLGADRDAEKTTIPAQECHSEEKPSIHHSFSHNVKCAGTARNGKETEL